MSDLKIKQPLPSVKRPLSATELVALLVPCEGWHLSGDGTEVAIEKTFSFADFHETMAFVNAVAFIAHTQNHHPDLSVHDRRCVVRWRTHDAGGITRTDLDCAARINALLAACTA